MGRHVTASQVGEARIRGADLASKRKRFTGNLDTERDSLLHIQRARVVPLPEPVVVPVMVNGRRLEPWEMGLYVEWMHGQRRAELALFAGLIG